MSQYSRGLPGLLRKVADFFDPAGAPKEMEYSFTFERGIGFRFRTDGRGGRLAYLGDEQWVRAHRQADTAWVMAPWSKVACVHVGCDWEHSGPHRLESWREHLQTDHDGRASGVTVVNSNDLAILLGVVGADTNAEAIEAAKRLNADLNTQAC